MKFNKCFTILLIFTFLCSCVGKLDLSPLLKSDEYLVVETSVADSIENTKSSAVNLIIQNIFSKLINNKIIQSNNLQSIFSKNTKLNKNYFNDIIFSDVIMLGKNQYKISAALTKKSIISTIDYLQNTLAKSNIDTLTYDQLIEKYTKTSLLISLIIYSSENNMPYNKKLLEELISSYKELYFKAFNGAKVTFIIHPKVNANIYILNKNYKPNKVLYLNPSSYYYTISADKYKIITNVVTLQNKENKIIHVYLQKLLKSFIKLKLLISDNNDNYMVSLVKPGLENILNKYQLTENNFSNASIEINFLELSNVEISNKYYYNLPIKITLSKKGNVIVSSIYNITYVANNPDTYPQPRLIIQSLDQFISKITYNNTLMSLY